MTTKILVSSCLLSLPVRYNGSAKAFTHPVLQQWLAEGRLVPVCPEVLAGFPVPRPSAEISGFGDGQSVLSRDAKVIETTGVDVTERFIAGAQTVLALAYANGCKTALFTDASPSCGSRFIYDGSFKNRKIIGVGVTSALLRKNGIEVFSEDEIDMLRLRLERFS